MMGAVIIAVEIPVENRLHLLGGLDPGAPALDADYGSGTALSFHVQLSQLPGTLVKRWKVAFRRTSRQHAVQTLDSSKSYVGSSICTLTEVAGIARAKSNAAMLSANGKVSVISGATSI
jgi:hypothetical protein